MVIILNYKDEEIKVELSKITPNIKLDCLKVNDEYEKFLQNELKNFNGDPTSLLSKEETAKYTNDLNDIIKSNKKVNMLNQEYIILYSKLLKLREELNATDLERRIKEIGKELNSLQKNMELKQKEIQEAFTREEQAEIMNIEQSKIFKIGDALNKKYKDILHINITKVIINKKGLDTDLLKEINSEYSSDFWNNQYCEELAKAYDYFLGY